MPPSKSLIPPEKPLQLARINNGNFSLLNSSMQWAVFKAESGYHTYPAY